MDQLAAIALDLRFTVHGWRVRGATGPAMTGGLMRFVFLRQLVLAAAVAVSLTLPGTARQANPTFSIEDATVAEGDGGVSFATFRVVLRHPNLVESRIHYLTADSSASAAAHTQSSGALSIPPVGTASPYPASIGVAGLTGTVQHVAVQLEQLTHTFPADLDVLLVGPGGQSAMVMSDIGASNDVIGITLTFQDGAPTPGAQLVTGTFAPADNAPAEAAMPAPAPAGPYGSSLSVFNGTNPNGVWQLFVNDDMNPDGGSLGGFSVVITTTTNGGDYVPTAGLLTFPPGIPARTLQVAIKGDTVIEGNEALAVNLIGPFNGVLGDGQGVGTLLNDDGVTTSQPPTGLYVSSMTGNLTTFRWNAPLVGPTPTGYVLAGGTTPGGVLASLPTGSAAPTFAIVAPTGSFYARVHTVSAAGLSPPSNEVLFHFGVPVAPSPPADLVGVVATSRVALAWRNTFTGGAPAALVLDVSGSLNASLPLGATDAFTFNSVPAGTYTFAVRAVNAAGSSPPSTPVTLTFPGACLGQLQPPVNFVAFRVGNVITALWDAPDLGPAPTGYVLNVGGSFVGGLPLPGKAVSGAVGPGTYLLNVQATNYCGAGLPTVTRTVTVP
jgi:subtilisin-like proprotein convertase family protein